jgi:hypothetical protein
MKAPPCFHDRDTKQQIDDICEANDIDALLLEELCEVVEGHSGSGRKEGITADLTARIDAFLERTTPRKR